MPEFTLRDRQHLYEKLEAVRVLLAAMPTTANTDAILNAINAVNNTLGLMAGDVEDIEVNTGLMLLDNDDIINNLDSINISLNAINISTFSMKGNIASLLNINSADAFYAVFSSSHAVLATAVSAAQALVAADGNYVNISSFFSYTQDSFGVYTVIITCHLK